MILFNLKIKKKDSKYYLAKENYVNIKINYSIISWTNERPIKFFYLILLLLKISIKSTILISLPKFNIPIKNCLILYCKI